MNRNRALFRSVDVRKGGSVQPIVYFSAMYISTRTTAGLAAIALTLTSAHVIGAKPAAKPAAKPSGGFELSVDSIMRGPKLVGYPPTGLRWSGDSSRLYFESRRPADEEA